MIENVVLLLSIVFALVGITVVSKSKKKKPATEGNSTYNYSVTSVLKEETPAEEPPTDCCNQDCGNCEYRDMHHAESVMIGLVGDKKLMAEIIKPKKKKTSKKKVSKKKSKKKK